ncbi:hypothetical protein ASE69_16465 [Sphingomonas sp. Leaf208]|uniref:oligosaccharide flippase family protein n=1 Tax=Sphingomonas sp. Leaf208 TaxID=1735679 RepID=UPI0006F9D692|nr:oligosaccharide flippase family protein [Sphingomonas sp. Leaf208]KQM46290.1 hypothetical protein ASE69_16465 [Sphingomonas sp. Leaf208]
MSRLARNAVWNIVGGMSTAIVSVALPPFLARLIDRDSFGAWALALQIAGYINLLNFGMQVIVGRLVAQADAMDDRKRRDRVVATSFVTLAVAGLIGVAVLAAISLRLDLVVPQAPQTLRPQIAITIVFLALAYAVQLPASVFGGVFIGLQRNSMYANGLMATRVLTFVAVLIVAYISQDLVMMGIAWFVASIVGAMYTTYIWRRYSPQPRLSIFDFNRSTLWELSRDGFAFTIWNLAMLMVSGFQLLIVARVDFADVGAFAVSSSIALFISGIMQAVCSTLVPHISSLMTLGEHSRVERSLRDVTATSVLLSSAMSICLVSIASPLMGLWMGKISTSQSGLILVLLVTAQAIRNAMMAYVMVAIALGLQRRMLLTPIIEGASSLGLSLFFGQRMGAVGVAVGMCGGAVIGTALLATQNVVKRAVPSFNIVGYVTHDVIRPISGFLITAACAIALTQNHHQSLLYVLAMIASGLFVSTAMSWYELKSAASLLVNWRRT